MSNEVAEGRIYSQFCSHLMDAMSIPVTRRDSKAYRQHELRNITDHYIVTKQNVNDRATPQQQARSCTYGSVKDVSHANGSCKC